MIQQPLLAPDAAAVSGQTAVASDDPVAGNNDGYRIFVVGIAHGAEGVGVAQRMGDVSIRNGLKVWENE